MMAYDPAFTNTASCRSEITYIDGEAGILQHRGYSIEQLCEHSSYLEVAYLLIFGELPTKPQLERWIYDITHHTFVHEDIKHLVRDVPLRRPPDGHAARLGVGALSTFYPDAKHIDDPEERYMAAIRLIAKMPTLAAFAYRHNMGLPYVYPDNDLSYSENFLSMMFKKTEAQYEPDPRLAKALDVLFILHADHEQNCSTNAVRGGRLVRGRPLLGRRRRESRRSTARCTAAPTRPCCGCSAGSRPPTTSPTSSRASRTARRS